MLYDNRQTMSGPWESHLALVDQPNELNVHYLAMLAHGLKPIETIDIGKPMRYLGTRTVFACGCSRIYRADLRTKRESEHVRPCESHGNLLTTRRTEA